MPVVDDKNPGRRQIKKFIPSGTLNSNDIDVAEVQTFGFKVLKNCRYDKRLGVVVKRGGSVTEDISGTLGIPLSMGEYVLAASAGSLPFNRSLLFNFAGGTFKKLVAGTYSDVTPTSRTLFASSKLGKQIQLGTRVWIAGGRPAFWDPASDTIERIGIVAPTQPITITSTSNAGSITLVDGTQFMYTFFNSITGLESDWSPLSADTGAITDRRIDITIPATAGIDGNWDQIRIYRTFDGGSIPYFITSVAKGTTSYVATATDAQLTTRATDVGDNGLPPAESFMVAAFAQCLWWVDAANPFKLVFSKPFIGSEVDLEYYPEDNYLITNQPITGLLAVPGKLLVFHPRDISFINGFSADDFAMQNFVSGVGTVFPHAVATSGTSIFFLAEQGVVTIPAKGGIPEHISREIDLPVLQAVIAGSYNAAMYMSACWNPSMRQFIFTLSVQSTAGAPWEEIGTGSTADAVAGWEDSISSATELWEDVNNPNTSYVMRNMIWGWSPELSQEGQHAWMEYTFADIADENLDGAFPIFAFHPQPDNSTGDPQQDRTYIALYTGTVGEVKTAFRKDLNTDDGEAFTAEILTDRISPGFPGGGYKIFHELGFNTAYSDPTSDSLATIKYLLDYEDPQLRSYTGELITIASNAEDTKNFPQEEGRFIHLHISDTSQSQSKVLLSEFFIHFRERFRRAGR